MMNMPPTQAETIERITAEREALKHENAQLRKELKTARFAIRQLLARLSKSAKNTHK